MSIDLQQFHSIFLAEAEEHLVELERHLTAYPAEQYAPEVINQLFRAAHSIKGSAAIFGFSQISELTHLLENIFDHIRQHQVCITQTHIDTCLDCVDTLQQLVDKPNVCVDISPFSQALTELLAALTTALETDAKRTTDLSDSSDSGFGFFDDHEHKHDDKHAPSLEGFGFFDEDDSPAPQSPDAPPMAPEQADLSPQKEQSIIRVDAAKIDELVNIVGELVIADSMLHQLALTDAQQATRSSPVLTNMTHNIRLMQHAILGLRMLPLSNIFNRFPRMVRKLSKALDKQVELTVIGADTEIDKGLIEQLVDPITHLLRNALDHGIETPAERRVAQKSETAQLLLTAEQRGGYIFITITDDGRGLNREKIIQKALNAGIISSPNLSDSQVWELILAPGFSTSDSVSEISGRGVGLDIVKQNIKKLDGMLFIDSTPGKGATFTIRIPLTLAIVDGMKLLCAGQLYVLPMHAIIESFRPTPTQIKTLTNDRFIQIRDAYYPLLSLHETLHPGTPPTDLAESIVILVVAGDSHFCLHVDSIEGQQQVVIKSLEKNYHAVPGIAGATIMGDGKVGYILDAEQLADNAKAQDGIAYEAG